jgi:hypothetical protein
MKVIELKPIETITLKDKETGEPKPVQKQVFKADDEKWYSVLGKNCALIIVGNTIPDTIKPRPETDKPQFKGGGGYKENPERQRSIEEMKRADIIMQLAIAGKITMEHELTKKLMAWLDLFGKGLVAPAPLNATASPRNDLEPIPVFKTGIEYLEWLKGKTGIEYQKQLEMCGYDTINKVKDWQSFAKKIMEAKK